MRILHYITLDFSRPNVAVKVYAVQGDEYSRGVVAQLVGGSQAWTPPAGAGGFIEYVRPDGVKGLYDTLEDGTPAVTISGSTVTLLFSAHALQVKGTLTVALRIVDSAGTKLRSFEFPVDVRLELVDDDEIVQTPYYNILTQQIALAVDAADRAQQAVAILEGAVQYLPQTKTAAEQTQARENIGVPGAISAAIQAQRWTPVVTWNDDYIGTKYAGTTAGDGGVVMINWSLRTVAEIPSGATIATVDVPMRWSYFPIFNSTDGTVVYGSAQNNAIKVGAVIPANKTLAVMVTTMTLNAFSPQQEG